MGAEVISSVCHYRIERRVYPLESGDKRAEFVVLHPLIDNRKWYACKAGREGKDSPMDFVQILTPGFLSIECADAMMAAIQMATDWLIEQRASTEIPMRRTAYGTGL